ncbi:hypothetical protein [Acidihalobacter ferrooxydans]|uniref:Lipoprotein n=1 Tax=Acidihalobacter ferrooxydans TaxID=1765967 RepID=A0A1P8UKT2_9GAMM|nr:hypothetical protein [Acidihalobacter ferrooxydans]APZ44457.1 hypothetical protein BW247_00585 [Acidihalobacter ferrooxydans]
MKIRLSLLGGAVLCLGLAGCSHVAPLSQAEACANGLNRGFAELQDAKAKGFSGSVSWIKAAGLLSAAKIQQQLNRYPSCINKTQRAREFIRRADMGL